MNENESTIGHFSHSICNLREKTRWNLWYVVKKRIFIYNEWEIEVLKKEKEKNDARCKKNQCDGKYL